VNGYLALVLVTGSRTFTDPVPIHDTLLAAWHDATQDGWSGIEVMEGTADGPDTISGDWADAHLADGVGHIQVEADWEGPCAADCRPGHRRARRGTTYCPQAGHRRNQGMVDRQPKVALAFIDACRSPRCTKPRPHDSHGVSHCIGAARNAGVPVVEVRAT
jgi:hypothetical protein